MRLDFVTPDLLLNTGFAILIVAIAYSYLWKRRRQNSANAEAIAQNDIEAFWSATKRFFPHSILVNFAICLGLLLLGTAGNLGPPEARSWTDTLVLIFSGGLFVQTLLWIKWFTALRPGTWAENQHRFLAKIVQKRFDRLRNRAPRKNANQAGVFD